MKSGDIFSTNVEKIFSPIKMRIIRYLYFNEYSTLSAIIQHIGSNHKVVSKHIRELEDIGVIHEFRVNKIRVFRLNSENEITIAIIKLFNALRSI